MARIGRRRALAALGAGLLGFAGCGDGRGDGRRSITAPQVPGRRDALSFNVHPLGGAALGLQGNAIAALAPPWIRVTLGLVSGTDEARPYSALGPSLHGLVADFRLGPIDPAEWLPLLEGTMRRNPAARRVELLREPERVNGLGAEQYVQEFLRPGYQRIRDRFPGVQVVAAAPGGDRRSAPQRFQRLTDAGADEFCDYRAAHVFFEDAGAWSAIRAATRRPILVTETGVDTPGRHVSWYTDIIPAMKSVLGAEQVFWYVLLESPSLASGPVSYRFAGTSVIAGIPDAAGGPQPAPGSGLYRLLAGSGLRPRR